MHIVEFLRHRASVYDLRAFAIAKDGYVDLQVLEVPAERRGRGLGTRFMEDICEEADRQGVVIGTCPEGRTAEYTARLVAWYKRLGFTPNPDTDTYRVSYVRMPRSPTPRMSDPAC